VVDRQRSAPPVGCNCATSERAETRHPGRADANSNPRNGGHGFGRRRRERRAQGSLGLSALAGAAGAQPHGDALGAHEQARQAPGGAPLHRAPG
jgi:hypothetical protein